MRAARFRSALEELGMTPTAAAKVLGVSGATARRWAAQGSCRGPAETLVQLLLTRRITAVDIARARFERR